MTGIPNISLEIGEGECLHCILTKVLAAMFPHGVNEQLVILALLKMLSDIVQVSPDGAAKAREIREALDMIVRLETMPPTSERRQ